MPREVKKNSKNWPKVQKYPICQRCGSRFSDSGSHADHLPCGGERNHLPSLAFVCNNLELNEVIRAEPPKQTIVKPAPTTKSAPKVVVIKSVPKPKSRKVRILSEEHRQKIREALTGENSPNFGVHHSAEHRRKISVSLTGKKNSRFGIPRSEETKKKISNSLKRRYYVVGLDQPQMVTA